MDGTTQLAVAELVIYSLLIWLALYLLLKHGRRGLEAWLFYCIFCTLRIVAAGIQIGNWNKIKHGKSSSETASIINSVGVSALLLCTCGLTREARTYHTGHNRKLGWLVVTINHVFIATGIALAAVGGSKLAEAVTQHDRDSNKALLIAGYFIILVAMIGQLVYAALSLRMLDASSGSASHRSKILIYGATSAVVILFARIVYSIVFGFTLKPSLNPYTGSLAVKVVLMFLVQLVASSIIGASGFLTRNLATSRAILGTEMEVSCTSDIK